MFSSELLAEVVIDSGWLIPAMLAAIAWRIFMGRLDRARIGNEVARFGGTVLSVTWNPFGRGWFGERSDRIYEVLYQTRSGSTVTATCKTSMTTGVYWSSDYPISGFAQEKQEATGCLSCGATISADHTRCPKCGWSYKNLPDDKSEA